MRMRRKKHLETRLAAYEAMITPLRVADRRFDGESAEQFLDPVAEFGNDHPVEMEIGCGKGGFIVQMAAAHPEINFWAVEKIGNVLVSACEAVEQAKLTNVRFLWGDAEYLPRFIPPHRIRRLYLNFSTPYPKAGQAIHRLTHRHFLAAYREWLAPGASIIQKTDGRRFFQFSLEEFSQSGYRLRQVSLDLHADQIPDNIVTEYEQRFLDQGLPIYRLEADLPE